MSQGDGYLTSLIPYEKTVMHSNKVPRRLTTAEKINGTRAVFLSDAQSL